MLRKSIPVCLLGLIIMSACSGAATNTDLEATNTRIVIRANTSLDTNPQPQKITDTASRLKQLHACLNVSALNVRAGPGTNHSIIGAITEGECTFIDAVSGDGNWGRTVSRSWNPSMHGWVALSFFNIDEDPSLLEVKEPALTQTSTKAIPSKTATRWPTPKPTVRNCHPSYPTVCLQAPPPDMDCSDIQYINFQVVGSDPHELDGDNDGIACEYVPPQPPKKPSGSNCSSCYSVCIPNYPPDLDCGQIQYCQFRVYSCDPHGFDGDGDGWGCEWCN